MINALQIHYASSNNLDIVVWSWFESQKYRNVINLSNFTFVHLYTAKVFLYNVSAQGN